MTKRNRKLYLALGSYFALLVIVPAFAILSPRNDLSQVTLYVLLFCCLIPFGVIIDDLRTYRPEPPGDYTFWLLFLILVSPLSYAIYVVRFRDREEMES